MVTAATITMAELSGEALLRLMTWLSPAFPVGAFSYSHGIESAVHDGLVHDRLSLTGWLADIVSRGSAWSDAALLAETWRCADGTEITDIAELAEALAGSRERHMETMLQGEAFVQAASAWPHAEMSGTEAGLPYPVAVAVTARAHGVPLEPACAAYLHGFASNLVQAAVRLVPLGQKDAVATMAALEEVILETVRRACASTLDDLGSATVMSEIMAMKHETQYSRVFRS